MKRIALIAVLVFGFNHGARADDQKTTMYGYINSYAEKSQNQPQIAGSGPSAYQSRDTNNVEYSVRDIHFVMQSSLSDRFKAFLNLKAPSAEGVEVSNAWVETQLLGDHLNFRMGKLYRPFEIYNEILDAVPTYIGIEPPELFDNDHLMVTRTTNLLLHGAVEAGPGLIRYSATSGNDERGGNSNVPLGLDVRYVQDLTWMIGASYYNSGGRAQPLSKTGSTQGGILPWMEMDSYDVVGAFGQYQDKNWTVQGSYFVANHKGRRLLNAPAGKSEYIDVVNDICAASNPLNARQYERFGCASGGNAEARYSIISWYTRLGYNLGLGHAGELTPYFQYDNYTNEETIQSKTLGGDNEAGQSDDGTIQKWTLGMVYRPIPPVAAKLDYSLHQQDVGGDEGNYGEVRFSLSYYWRM